MRPSRTEAQRWEGPGNAPVDLHDGGGFAQTSTAVFHVGSLSLLVQQGMVPAWWSHDCIQRQALVLHQGSSFKHSRTTRSISRRGCF